MYCSPLLLDLLLNNGASLFLKNSEGQTALDVAHEACTVEKDDNQNALLCIGNLSRKLANDAINKNTVLMYQSII